VSGELEYREAQAVAVDFPSRVIEVIVTPWEQETEIRERGKVYREIFSRGAYDGVERRPNRIRANLNHDHTRWVGRVVALHPSREEGLLAEVRIAQTTDGENTLHLADDGILDASAEFQVMPGGETWTGKLRRITKAWLGGIAFTGDPAYPGARVVAVRAADALPDVPPGIPLTTPNFDRLELERWSQMAADLDRRYSLR
jgi:HK97 family phage prohead protease